VAKPTVLFIATKDTKEAEIALIRSYVEEAGCNVIHMDPSIRAKVGGAEIPPDQVAEAAGTTIEDVRAIGHEGECLGVMIKGAIALAIEAFSRQEFSAVLSLGGSMGSALGTSVMRALPYGVPKVMISTMASGYTAPFVGTKDIIMVNPVTDVSGLNSINREVYRNAALAVAGMAKGYAHNQAVLTVKDTARAFADDQAATPDRPLILIGTLGATEQCTRRVREGLERRGFEVMIFHTVGRGGPTLDAIVAERNVAAVLELSWTEIVDEIFGGLAAAGPDRAKAGLRKGVPTIFAPGNVDFMLGGDYDDTVRRFPNRRYHRHNPAITAVRTTLDDLKKIGDRIVEITAEAKGPVRFVMPLGGYSYHDCPTGRLYEPTLPAPFADYVRSILPETVPLTEVAHHINDAAFADAVVAETLDMLSGRTTTR